MSTAVVPSPMHYVPILHQSLLAMGSLRDVLSLTGAPSLYDSSPSDRWLCSAFRGDALTKPFAVVMALGGVNDHVFVTREGFIPTERTLEQVVMCSN